MNTSSAPSAWLDAKAAACLLGMSPRTVKRHCAAGAFKARTSIARGGNRYEVALESLPLEAQERFTLASARGEAESEAPSPRVDAEQFSKLPERWRRVAAERKLAVERMAELLAAGRTKVEAAAAVATEIGESTSTLKRWERLVRGLPRGDWMYALAPGYRCAGPTKRLHPDAWSYICADYLRQQGPALVAVYRRAQEEALRRGWGALPSVKTIKRRLDAIDRDLYVYRREGETALEQSYPAQVRDYSKLGVHDIWVTDGRKADLFARFPDGVVCRPIVMAWMDVRTRRVLGWALAKSESAELVRASLRVALVNARAMPREVYMDNGRAYAGKEISGGQPLRNRFKHLDGEVTGILPLLGISPIWARPYHGQSKPIESFWRTIAETERRPEFCGAYCGNKPEAKPEDFDPRKAVDLQQYEKAIEADLQAYHERAHRGDSMDKRSPNAMYAEMMAGAVVRQPAAWQLALCLQRAERVRLDAKDRSFVLKGNRNRYWSEAIGALAHRGPFTARYNPDDAEEPVALFDGERYVATAKILDTSGFRSREDAKAHERARREYVKAARTKAAALLKLSDTGESWMNPPKPSSVVVPAVAQTLPDARVAELVRLPIERPAQAQAPDAREAFERALQAGIGKRTGKAEEELQKIPRVAGAR